VEGERGAKFMISEKEGCAYLARNSSDDTKVGGSLGEMRKGPLSPTTS
jgi:hypothetical protein